MSDRPSGYGRREPDVEDAFHCNNCGDRLWLPDRGIVPFDGRFCGHECKAEFAARLVQYNLRGGR